MFFAAACLVVSLSHPGGVAGQSVAGGAGHPIPNVDDFRHDGNVGEWRARPIDRILPSVGRIPQALLWVGQVEEGIVVAAEIRAGVEPDERATLRIGLRGGGEVELPPIGWGHQFGFVTLEEATDCGAREFGEDEAACAAWFTRQQEFRAALTPLFEREWRLQLAAPDELTESHATDAFGRLPQPARAAVGALAPRGRPQAKTRAIVGTEGGVGVEVLIPWSAFPPVRAPLLEAVHLALDWVEPGSSGTDGSAWLLAAGLRPLQNPIDHIITPCRYGLAGVLIPGGDGRFSRPTSAGAVAYMIPESSGDLRSLIVLDNVAEGYLYDPTLETWSPAAFEPEMEVLDVGRGERVCTPVLAFAKDGERVGPEDWTETGEGDWFGLQVDPREIDVRRLDDGNLLVKSGARVAWSYFGSGQCGGCPRVGIDFFHISQRTGRITPAMRFLEIAEPTVRDIEISVSEDWRTVTIYRSEPRLEGDILRVDWGLTRYCMTESVETPLTFEICGEETGVAEPEDRLRRRYGGGAGA